MTSSLASSRRAAVHPARRRLPVILMALLAGVALLLACDAVNSIVSNPVFTCPSPTPYFPWDFLANPSSIYPIGTSFNVQYYAQSTGDILLSYTEYGAQSVVLLSESNLVIATAPVGVPGFAGVYPIYFVPGVQSIDVTVSDSVQNIVYSFSVYPNLPVIFPTLQAPYTPVPRPTASPFVLNNNFYLGDTVYATGSTSRIGITLVSVDSVSPNYDDLAFTWTFKITNIGGIEYDFYPYFQSYMTGVTFSGAPITHNIWVASLALGEQMGYPISVAPVPIQPGQTQTFTLFTDGFNVGDFAVSFAFVLDPINHNAASPTIIPGSDIVQFLNQPDPFCHAQIQPPTGLPLVTATP